MASLPAIFLRLESLVVVVAAVAQVQIATHLGRV
jgi:hypothetical protein